MSRIMLCLKAMMARYTNMPSMIFDEIDTGVSGSVAKIIYTPATPGMAFPKNL